MRRKLRKFILIVTLTLCVGGARAATIEVDGFTYTTNTTKKTAELTKGPTTGDIVIPSTVSDGTDEYSVTSIKAKAFKGAAITSVSIPGSITKFGSSVFEGCTSLTSVELEEGLTKIGSSMFKGCTALPSITFPSTLTDIGMWSFDGCTLITEIVIPDGVKSVTGSPFQNCTGLRKITLGAKVTSFSVSSTCSKASLEEIIVVDSNTRLASVDGVLYDKKITKLECYPPYKKGDVYTMPATVSRMSERFSEIQYLKKVVLSDNVTYVSYNSFSKCPELTTLVVGKGVEDFGAKCFADCPKFTAIEIDEANPYIKYEDYAVISIDGTVLYTRIPNSPAKYVAPASLRRIGELAFYQNEKLTELTLPEVIDSIGTYAFQNCTGLSSVAVPAGIRYVSEGLFYNCKTLRSVTLPEGVEKIMGSAFCRCYSLDDLKIPESVDSIGDNAFENTNFTSIVIGDNVKTIGVSAFDGIEGLTELSIGCGVESIGDNAFRNYYSYGEITLTVDMKPTVPPVINVGDSYAPFEPGTIMFVPKASLEAYTGNENYAGYVVKARAEAQDYSVTVDAAGTLQQKISEEEVNGVATLKVTGEISGADFEYMNKMLMMKSLDLSDATIVPGGTEIVTAADEMPKFSIASLLKLESVILPDNLKELGDSCLSCKTDTWTADTKLATVVIPETVTSIGDGAFGYRGGIENIKLPDGLTYLGKNAFYYCSGLKSIEVPAGVDTIRDECFLGCEKLVDITLHEGVRAICERAFMNCDEVTDFVMPNSVDSVGNGAFQSMKKLKNVTLSNNLRMLYPYAFAWNESIERLDLPESLTYISHSCFAGCNSLRECDLPGKVETLGQSIFSLNPVLERILIPRSIMKMGSSICDRCTSLKYAVVAYDYDIPGRYEAGQENPDAPAKMNCGTSTFSGCESLESLYLGAVCHFLGHEFAAKTPNLKEIYVSRTTPPDMFDGEPAFDCYDATLYVPGAAILDYANNRHWKKFRNIKAIESNMSGLDNFFADADANDVTVGGGIIYFNNPDARVSVTNLSGQLLYSGRGGEVEVAPGLYIVTVNSKPYKVVVE